MTFKPYLTLPALLLSLYSFSQPTDLRSIDNSLTSTFKRMVSADYGLRLDSLAPLFKEELFKQLTSPVTFNNSLDSVSKYLTIKTSADRKIKFYSWDDLGGGTWHSMNCIAQYKAGNGKIIVQQLNTGQEMKTGEYTDSKIYEVHEIFIDTTKFYLTFAWGTHGSGNQHDIIQIFKIADNKLLKCKSCFVSGKDPAIEYPRGEKLNLTFNPETNEISFTEFKYEADRGYYKGQNIKLKLMNGVFVAR